MRAGANSPILAGAMDLSAAFAEPFPISSDLLTIELVEGGDLRREDEGPLVATLRTTLRDADGDARVHEQSVDVVYADYAEDARVPAYFAGWALALRELLTRLAALDAAGALRDEDRERLAGLDPQSLVHPDVFYFRHIETPEEFAHALLFGTLRLGRFLPDSLDIAAAFLRHLPISAGRVALEFVPETVDEATGEVLGGFQDFPYGGQVATLRWVVYDGEGAEREVCASAEERVSVAPSVVSLDPRLPEYFAGWAAALRTVLDSYAELDAAGALSDEQRARLEELEPSELVFPDVLQMRRPRTPEAFADALLAGGKRLGRLLP